MCRGWEADGDLASGISVSQARLSSEAPLQPCPAFPIYTTPSLPPPPPSTLLSPVQCPLRLFSPGLSLPFAYNSFSSSSSTATTSSYNSESFIAHPVLSTSLTTPSDTLIMATAALAVPVPARHPSPMRKPTHKAPSARASALVSRIFCDVAHEPLC